MFGIVAAALLRSREGGQGAIVTEVVSSHKISCTFCHPFLPLEADEEDFAGRGGGG